ncbi:MAG: c-type cytochrome [Cyclobacteriaceae bacterium]|nr:c-type cytochrome [Cyclobacteriaceae bacterium]MCH8515179.1 c-type cytochrome [Cyclobacteriaceae bacterium]
MSLKRLFIGLIRIQLVCCFLFLSSVQGSMLYAQDAEEQEEESAEAESSDSDYDEAVVNAGRSIFEGECTVCHAINEKVIGPALKNVESRWDDRDLLKQFILNSQKVIQSGHEYSVKLYEQYDRTVMPSFDYNDEELESILAYIDYASNQKEQTASSGGGASASEGGGGEGGGGSTAGVPSEYLTIILVGLIIVLILILVVLLLIISVLGKFLNNQDGIESEDKEVIDQRFNIGSFVQSRAFISLVIFLFVAIVTKTGIDALYTVGIQQGYAPTQPIAFSHKLHAGEYEIECQYCHTSVEKSKSANIPSANICMNCHSEIKTDSPEIQKIYAAVENEQPIEWVRIHNLPDLAYFNHAQHVTVGGLECETCHGDIAEMEVVYQYSSLTMGWCIECHQESEVNTKDNAYYDKLVEFHKKKGGEPMKVTDIGGLECSKCHY